MGGYQRPTPPPTPGLGWALLLVLAVVAIGFATGLVRL